MTAPPGRPEPDLLLSGDDPPRREWTHRRRRTVVAGAVAAVLVAVTAGALVLVQQDRAADERRRRAAGEQDVVRLVLLQPGQDNAPRYGPRRPGVHLVVGNAGPATVQLQGGALVPGAWSVEVPTDRELRPGRSVQVELLPPRACGAPEPKELRVRALTASGRPAVAPLDLTGAFLAYGGRLADALAAAELDCDPTPAR